MLALEMTEMMIMDAFLTIVLTRGSSLLLRDEPLNLTELLWCITTSHAEKIRLLAKSLREAHDYDVWKIASSREI